MTNSPRKFYSYIRIKVTTGQDFFPTPNYSKYYYMYESHFQLKRGEESGMA